ncbi:hypothetical protein N9H95_03775 [Gammaproteobacteria bacterium]|nr:hypothetical protein [Gammaproteobacteria bacterium]
MNELFFITDQDLLTAIKVFMFGIALMLIPFAQLLKSKFNLTVLIMSFHFIAMTMVYRGVDDIVYGFLFVIPFIILCKRRTVYIDISKFAYYFVLLYFLVLIFILLMPTAYIGSKYVPATLASGPHTSVYSILIYMFAIFLAYKKRHISILIWLPILFMTIFFLLEYQVRNAQLGIILFFFTYYFYESRLSNTFRNSAIFLLILFSSIILFTLFTFINIDLNDFSSGRLLAWAERLNILINRSFIELFFGTGYGSDLITTDQWWWKAKNSHNDFIGLLFNGGFLSLGFILWIFYKMFNKANSFQKGLIVFILVTSLTNTGYLGRPIQFLFMVIIIISATSLKTNSRAQ